MTLKKLGQKYQLINEIVRVTNGSESIANSKIGIDVRTSCEVALQAVARHVTRKPCNRLKRLRVD